MRSIRLSPSILFSAVPLAIVVACGAPSDEPPAAESAAALSAFKNPLAAPPMTTATDVFAGDFDGNGTADAARWLTDGRSQWEIGRSCGVGFNPQLWSGDWGSDGPIHVGDLDGDKKSDTFMFRATDNTWSVNLSNGAGWQAATWTGDWGTDGPNFVGDLNADGKSDVFMWRGTDNVWTVNISNGKGFTSAIWTGAWGSDGPIHIGDLNGDGRTDVFMWRGWNNDWTVNLSSGSGWSMSAWHGADGSDGPINVGDLNGDKKTDVFMWRDADKVWTVNTSTGSGWNSAIWQGAWGSDGPINVGDLNGDGKDDVFMWRGDFWTVNISTGTGFAAAEWAGNPGSAGPVHVADLNGDKKADVFVFDAANDRYLVNLSTGTGFTPVTWAAEPSGGPKITSLVVPATAGPNAEIPVTVTASVPPGCVPDVTSDAFDSSGHSVGGGFLPMGTEANGSFDTNFQIATRPLTISVIVSCPSTNACVPAATSVQANAVVGALPTPAINSFTTSPEDGSPEYGRQCYGLAQTFNWNVQFPGAGCTKPSLTLSATDDDNGGKEFFVAKDLAATGTLTHKANTDAKYTLTAACADDGTSVQKTIPVSIAPAADCTSGGTKKTGSTFCFKAIGLASMICSVDEIVSDNSGDALKDFEAEFPVVEFNDTGISCENALTACPGL